VPEIAIIGTGSWGVACSLMAAHHGLTVTLWGRDRERTERLARDRRLDAQGGAQLPAAVRVTHDPADLGAGRLALWGVPSQHTRAVAKRLRPHLPPRLPMVSLTKGLELGTLQRATEILASELGREREIGCLSGPSIAREVAAGLPACLVAAGSAELVGTLTGLLHGRAVRLYSSSDVLGVELGGALKNIIAIAAGICEGLGFGDNSKAAIVTRGLAEMRRLGRAMGACDATFAGMAGVGDLLTTCYSAHSRNHALGLAIARGENPLELLQRSHTVAEGAWTCRAAVELGQRHRVELPIASQVASVIWDATPVPRAMELLLARAPKEEDA
jgi:glycerol-3-phosphate dehydrogenase (NAD(P)+)